MAKITKSMRGETVNFDLMAIKGALAALPITENVKKRERFINKKRRRGMKRKVDEMANNSRLESANFKSATENLSSQPLPEVAEMIEVDEVESSDNFTDSDSQSVNKRRKVK